MGLATLTPLWPGENLSKWNLDAPAALIPEPPKGINSRAHVVLELARREKYTVRQLYEYLAGARGHGVVAGTPETIADRMQEWFENSAADCFNVMAPALPRRGLFCTAYEGTTLRENLGLLRPASRYATLLAKAA